MPLPYPSALSAPLLSVLPLVLFRNTYFVHFFFAILCLFTGRIYLTGGYKIDGLPRLGKKRDIRIGLIVPVHNEGGNILPFLQCLYKKPCPHMEVIFVDDASSDNSVELLKQYQEKYGYTIIPVEKQPLVADVLNQGLARVSPACNFIGVINSDCVFPVDTLERVVERLAWYDIEVLNLSNHAEMPRGLPAYMAYLEKQFRNELCLYQEASLNNGYFLRREFIQKWETITEDLNLTLSLPVPVYQDPGIYVMDCLPQTGTQLFNQKYRWVYGDMVNRLTRAPKGFFGLMVNFYYLFPAYTCVNALVLGLPAIYGLQVCILAIDLFLFLKYVGGLAGAVQYVLFQFFFQIYFFGRTALSLLRGTAVSW